MKLFIASIQRTSPSWKTLNKIGDGRGELKPVLFFTGDVHGELLPRIYNFRRLGVQRDEALAVTTHQLA